MNKKMRPLVIIAAVIVLLAMTTNLAAAKELTSLTISGPGIGGEMTLSNPAKDPGAMGRLEQSGFFDQAAAVKPPENLAEGYTITAYLNLDGKVVPFVQMVYYPGQEGEAGYIHTIGRYDGDSLQAADQWATMRPQSEAALRDLTAAYGITLQPAVLAAAAGSGLAVDSQAAPGVPAASAATTAAAEPATLKLGYPLLAIAAAVSALTAAIWFAGSHRARRQVPQTGDD